MPKLLRPAVVPETLHVDDPAPFAARLKELREQAGISQYELAKRASLSKQAVSLIETGKREPGWKTVVKIARALGVPVGAFDVEPPAGEADEPPEDEPPAAPKRRRK